MSFVRKRETLWRVGAGCALRLPPPPMLGRCHDRGQDTVFPVRLKPFQHFPSRDFPRGGAGVTFGVTSVCPHSALFLMVKCAYGHKSPSAKAVARRTRYTHSRDASRQSITDHGGISSISRKSMRQPFTDGPNIRSPGAKRSFTHSVMRPQNGYSPFLV